MPFGAKKKRAVRSLSANLYGLINKPTECDELESLDMDSTLDESFDDLPTKCISRRISDPELLTENWRRVTHLKLDVNTNPSQTHITASQQQRNEPSDVDMSNRSCDESSDERIRTQDRLPRDKNL